MLLRPSDFRFIPFQAVYKPSCCAGRNISTAQLFRNLEDEFNFTYQTELSDFQRATFVELVRRIVTRKVALSKKGKSIKSVLDGFKHEARLAMRYPSEKRKLFVSTLRFALQVLAFENERGEFGGEVRRPRAPLPEAPAGMTKSPLPTSPRVIPLVDPLHGGVQPHLKDASFKDASSLRDTVRSVVSANQLTATPSFVAATPDTGLKSSFRLTNGTDVSARKKDDISVVGAPPPLIREMSIVAERTEDEDALEAPSCEDPDSFDEMGDDAVLSYLRALSRNDVDKAASVPISPMVVNRYHVLFSRMQRIINRRVDMATSVNDKLNWGIEMLFFSRLIVDMAEREKELHLLPPPLEMGLLKRREFGPALSDPERAPAIVINQGTLCVKKMVLGRGSYGVVNPARLSLKPGTLWYSMCVPIEEQPETAHQVVAVKTIALGHDLRDQYRRCIDVALEVMLLHAFAETGIVIPIFDAYMFEEPSPAVVSDGIPAVDSLVKASIVTERARMDGHRFVYSYAHTAEKLAVFRQAAECLHALHERGFAHNDFKLENVLVFETEDMPKVVLGDLGFVVPLTGVAHFPYAHSHVGGTHPAPEGLYVKQRKANDLSGIDFEKVDVFSFGIELYTFIRAYFGREFWPVYESRKLKAIAQCSTGLSSSVWEAADTNLKQMRECLTGYPKGGRASFLVFLALDCLKTHPKDRIGIKDLMIRMRRIYTRALDDKTLLEAACFKDIGKTEFSPFESNVKISGDVIQYPKLALAAASRPHEAEAVSVPMTCFFKS